MDELIAWCGFAGAWLLFAGPVYQAVLELQDQDIQRDRMEEIGEQVEAPPAVSHWWWLLPPVWFLLNRRRQRQWREVIMAALPASEVEALIDYLDKAAGWLLVGLGGLLIAAKETWELVEHYEWPTYVFWILVVVMVALASANAARRTARTRTVLHPDPS